MGFEILVVDDEEDIRTLIADILSDEGYRCRMAAESNAVFSAIDIIRPDLLILDIWLEGSPLDGMQILEKINAELPNLPVIIISGHGNVETAVNAIKLGAYDFIEKPFKADRLLLTAKRALESARLQRENEELRRKTGPETEIIGVSSAIKQLRVSLDKIAPTDSRVLISGPAGSGKEVFARRLHALSNRASKPFVVLNCATMNPDRMEIELFGSENNGSLGKGQAGTLEQADGGTLLLDEVSDMPLETQGKIVRVLQDQTFNRVGGAAFIRVNVRVIASTNKDMNKEMIEGNFREDLFYRLSVVPIKIFPLSERPDDIPELVKYFMEQSVKESGAPSRLISPDAMAALQTYDWPGNVRQLRNVVDWILIMASGNSKEALTIENLPPDIGTRTSSAVGWEEGARMISMPLREARENFERQYLLAQINRFGGNISRPSEFIGMERSALHRKLKSLGVSMQEVTQSVTIESSK